LRAAPGVGIVDVGNAIDHGDILVRQRGLGRADRCAHMQGSTLHAAAPCEAENRQGLERLHRCVTAPALVYQRVLCNADGQVVRNSTTSSRHGTTPLVIAVLELMQRLPPWFRARGAPDPPPRRRAAAQRQAARAGDSGRAR
jgi:hypothetical protein